MKNYHIITYFLLLLIVCLPAGRVAAEDTTPPAVAGFCSPSCMLMGKSSLEMGDYEKALVYLSAAYKEMPFLGDYILLWRAMAFEGKAEYDKSLEDIRTIESEFPDSPLTRSVRLHEIELAQKTGEKDIDELFRKFIADYPSEAKAKFAYASFLKYNGEKSKAKAFFKELYLSVTPFSKSSGEELSSSDIRAADLLKKGRNLNNAWLFAEAEKQFREALRRKDASHVKKELTEGLAYALFRQKKYKEAAGLYSDCDNRYWKAKSLFRAGDMDGFEAEISSLSKLSDKRIASLYLAYGSKRRRSGDIETALSIYANVLAKYPTAKEDALWHEGWTYYRTGDYRKALDIFSSLHDSYGNTRYLYWKNRCLEMLGSSEPIQAISLVPNDRNNNFYMFITALKKDTSIPPFDKSLGERCGNYHPSRRIAALEDLGFRREALAEITFMANKNLPEQDIACLSAYLRNMKDFKTSISMIARLAYQEDFHELYYPQAYLDQVEEAARANDIDPLLVLSIMREESRFAPDARSVAGALGLMQLMPQTASRLSKPAKVSMTQPDDLYDVRTNVFIGAYYLKSLITHFNSVPLAVAAYNAGEDAVKGWLKAGNYKSPDEFIEDIPYDETRNYVKKVLTSYFEYMRQTGRKEVPSALLKKGNF